MDWFNVLIQNFTENFDKVLFILAIFGIAIDFTPFIKIQPVRFLLKTLGNWLNKDILNEVNLLKDKLEKLEKSFNAHVIEVQRQDILAFANDCINHIAHTKEEFDHVIETHSSYVENISENNIENGRVDLAYKIIENDYLNHIENDSFLERGV